MYRQRAAFLLLTLFVAVVASQDGDIPQACFEASLALAANQPCFNAVAEIGNSFQANTAPINREGLNVYCTRDCRNLNNRVLTACSDDTEDNPMLDVDVTELVCTFDGDVSCYEFLNSQFIACKMFLAQQ